MSDLIKTIVEIARIQLDFCHCGNPKNPSDLFCVSCRCERYAERKSGERELSRAIYGPDVANGD